MRRIASLPSLTVCVCREVDVVRAIAASGAIAAIVRLLVVDAGDLATPIVRVLGNIAASGALVVL
jgi:hypothetical protein